jgi:hypothetical protein
MNKLEFQDNTDPDIMRKIDYSIPDNMPGIEIRVDDGKDNVELVVGMTRTILTPQGARDLALALRQSANRVERQWLR